MVQSAHVLLCAALLSLTRRASFLGRQFRSTVHVICRVRGVGITEHLEGVPLMDPMSITTARHLHRRQRRRRDRSVFPVALVVSAAIHVLVLSLRLDAPITNQDPVGTSGAANSGTFRAMRIYDVVAVEDATPSLRTAVVERPDVQLRQTVAELEALSTDDRSDLPMPASRASIAESIAPRPSDPRLWAGARAEVSTVDVARARFYASIAPYRDSIAARSEARRRSTDWTRTDVSGGRWGISPDTIHLGKATLSPDRKSVV